VDFGILRATVPEERGRKTEKRKEEMKEGKPKTPQPMGKGERP